MSYCRPISQPSETQKEALPSTLLYWKCYNENFPHKLESNILHKKVMSMHGVNDKLDLRNQLEDLLQGIDGLEKALLESGESFRSLADFTPVGVYLNDAQGNAIYINKKCAELVGVPAEEALNFNWIPFLHPDDRERMVSAWEDAVKNSSKFHLEYRWVHSDGKVVWTLGEVSPIIGDKGKANLFIGTLTDITERKQAEEALQESESTFKKLFEESSDAILLLDDSGVFVECNQAALDLLKMPKEQFILLQPFQKGQTFLVRNDAVARVFHSL